ncbi:hypothetical protein ACTMU2_13745 [Cupriavidus basilensis]
MLTTPAMREQFRNDGVTIFRNCLNEAQLAQCYDAFKWDMANPGPHVYKERPHRHHVAHPHRHC